MKKLIKRTKQFLRKKDISISDLLYIGFSFGILLSVIAIGILSLFY